MNHANLETSTERASEAGGHLRRICVGYGLLALCGAASLPMYAAVIDWLFSLDIRPLVMVALAVVGGTVGCVLGALVLSSSPRGTDDWTEVRIAHRRPVKDRRAAGRHAIFPAPQLIRKGDCRR